MRRIQTKDNNCIEYDDFVDFVMPVYCSKSQESPVKQADPSQRRAWRKQLFAGLKELLVMQMLNEINIESLREKLAIFSSFSVTKCFEDCQFNNMVTAETLAGYLTQLGVEFEKDHVFYVMKRFGNGTCLSLEGLKKLLVPKNLDYANKVMYRTSGEISELGLEALKELFRGIFQGEKMLDKKKACFDGENMFNDIDIDGDGIVSVYDMKNVLFNSGLDVTDRQVEMLCDRYAHSSDGIFDPKAFQDEVLPSVSI